MCFGKHLSPRIDKPLVCENTDERRSDNRSVLSYNIGQSCYRVWIVSPEILLKFWITFKGINIVSDNDRFDGSWWQR